MEKFSYVAIAASCSLKKQNRRSVAQTPCGRPWTDTCSQNLVGGITLTPTPRGRLTNVVSCTSIPTHTEITKLLLPCCNLATALIKYTLQQGSVNLASIMKLQHTLAHFHPCKWVFNTLL